jgi:hypothetical protein
MLLFTESQIDHVIRHRRAAMFGGLTLMALPFVLPQGWGLGFFSGFVLLSLSIYSFCFQKWRSEPGLWMLALLLTMTLGPCLLYFEYLHWRSVFFPAAANKAARPMAWNEIRLSIDAAIALLILGRTVKLSLSVIVENWRRTRIGRNTTNETLGHGTEGHNS